MKLEQLEKRGVKDLYPPLVTRSKQEITTTEVTLGGLGDGGLPVLIKTLFPPSDLRRTDLVVTEASGDLLVRPIERTGMADAQRFAQLLLERGQLEEPDARWAPLRVVKDEDGRPGFLVGPGPVTTGSLAADRPSRPSTPSAKRAQAEKGDS